MGFGFGPRGEEFDSSLSLDVEPLQSLEAIRKPKTGVSPLVAESLRRQTPGERSTAVDDDGQGREFLAQILLSLGQMGGQKAPAFLTDEIADRRKERREVAKEERKATRTRDAGALLAEGLRAEIDGDDNTALQNYQRVMQTSADPAVTKEAASYLKAVVDRQKSGAASDRATEIATRLGTKALSRATYVRLANELKAANMDASTINQVLSRMDIQYKQEGDFMVGRMGGTGQIVAAESINKLREVGGQLIQTEGTRVTGTFKPAQRMTQSEGQQIVEIPAQTSGTMGAEPGPVPAAGQVVPAGGLQTEPAQAPQTGAPKVLSPAPVKRTPLSADDQVHLKSVGISKTYVDDLSKDEAQILRNFQDGKRSEVRPTAEQAKFLSARGIPTNLTWDQIRQKYPNAATVLMQDEDLEAGKRAAAVVAAKRNDMKTQPFAVAFPQSTKVAFNKETRQRDDLITVGDIEKGKGVLLNAAAAEAVSKLNGMVPSIDKLESVTKAILAIAPGTNMAQALRIAVQRGLASSEDIAIFDALSGTLGLSLASIMNEGRPSEADAQAVQKSFPKENDTVRTGLAKLRVLKKLLLDGTDARLGKPVGPLTRKSLEPKDDEPVKKDGIPLPGGKRANSSAWD